MNLINYNKEITVITVSYHSSYIIENLIKALDENIKIIIIENSLDKKFKENLEEK